MHSDPALAPRVQPKSPGDLFISFTILALQGFGGVLAVAQRELVERKRWMTNEEFVEEWSVAQIMPGPNIINLSIMLGSRYFGLRGAVAAVLGMLTAPMLVVLLIALLYARFADHPGVAGALRGMGAVAAGLIIAVGLKLFPALRNNALGLGTCIVFGLLCFLAIAVLRWPLAYVLLGLGSLACLAAYRKLQP
ncbi:MAG TPA: chromate transporter [Curvibacter sp.]|nr:chromate transporter [Curvibacter sp.]|tara:strand:- start:133 stop:711 length:579 start_codon:yes stop_codon:yes gene_type:complete